MTITVEAAPLSVTVTGDVTFTVTAGQQGVELSDSTSSISFANPTEEDAKITVESSTNNISPLLITVTASSGTGYARVNTGALWDTTSLTASRDLVTTVDAGAEVSNKSLRWDLGGNAPSETGVIITTFTYTIAEK